MSSTHPAHPSIHRITAPPDGYVVSHAKNLGFPAALRSGIDSAKGDLVAIIDSDDIARPNWLELVVPVLVNNSDIGSAGGGCTFLSEDGLDTGWLGYCSPHGDVTKIARGGGYPFLHPGSVHRRSTLLSIGGYNSKIKSAEDMDLFLSMSYVSRLINVGQPLIKYRRRRFSESRKTSEYNAAIAAFLKAKGALLAAGKTVAEANQTLSDQIESLSKITRVRKVEQYEYDLEMAQSFELGKHHWHAFRHYLGAIRSGQMSRSTLRAAFRCLVYTGLKWSNPLKGDGTSSR